MGHDTTVSPDEKSFLATTEYPKAPVGVLGYGNRRDVSQMLTYLVQMRRQDATFPHG